MGNVDSTTDLAALISFGSTNELYGRIGARVAKDWTTMNGGTAQAFGEFNVWDQLGDKNAKTAFANLQGTNPTTVTSLLGGSWAQFKVGVSGPVAHNVSVFGNIDYNVAFSQAGHSLGGRVGLTVA